jgi:hypothetical protein
MLSAPAGVATADDVDASTRLRSPTAWAFIESRPELRNIALILDYAGYRNTLSGPFRGTLLLPTNDVSAFPASALATASTQYDEMVSMKVEENLSSLTVFKVALVPPACPCRRSAQAASYP